MITETSKSQICHIQGEGPRESWWYCSGSNLMSENWRADGISSILNVISQEQGVLIYDGRRIWLSQLKQRENPPFLQNIEIFVLFKPSTDWMTPISIDEINVLI